MNTIIRQPSSVSRHVRARDPLGKKTNRRRTSRVLVHELRSVVDCPITAQRIDQLLYSLLECRVTRRRTLSRDEDPHVLLGDMLGELLLSDLLRARVLGGGRDGGDSVDGFGWVGRHLGEGKRGRKERGKRKEAKVVVEGEEGASSADLCGSFDWSTCGEQRTGKASNCMAFSLL
jgi:hypothetical protein